MGLFKKKKKPEPKCSNHCYHDYKTVKLKVTTGCKITPYRYRYRELGKCCHCGKIVQREAFGMIKKDGAVEVPHLNYETAYWI